MSQLDESVACLAPQLFQSRDAVIEIPPWPGLEPIKNKGREKGNLTVAVSNLPTGAVTVFDAPYTLRVTNTGNGRK